MKNKYIFFAIVFFTLSIIMHGQSNYFDGNGNTGFGGLLGDGGLDIDFQASPTSTTDFIFTPGGGAFNDLVVIYIDSDQSGNFIDTSSFTDVADDHRKAISGYDGTNRSEVIFPPGFEADYAIAFNPSFAGLWKLSNGSHAFLQDLDIFFDGDDYLFFTTMDNTFIGDPNSFKFLSTYVSNTAFRSDEAIGEVSSSGNPGQNPIFFDNYWTTSAEIGGFGSTTSIATVWSFDGSWTNGNVPFDTDYITLNHDIIADINATLGTLVINTPNQLTINPGIGITITDNMNNSGTVSLNSSSTSFSSIIPQGTVTNSGTIQYNRYANAQSNGNDLVSSPLSGGTMETFGAFAGNNSNLYESTTTPTEKLFGPFDNANDAYISYDTTTNSGTPLEAGKGYRTGTDPAGTLTFTGDINTGSEIIDIPLEAGSNGKWNLIGNLYPAYFDLEQFLIDNGSSFNSSYFSAYGWNGSSWTTYNLASSNGVFFTPGQGFFVASASASATVTFDTDLAVIGSGDDFIIGRSSQNNPNTYLRLQLSHSSTNLFTDFYFLDNASQGLDPGYDSGSFNAASSDFSIYSHLVADNVGIDMAIQSLSNSDLNDVVIPLGINALQGQQIEIGIESSNLPETINVYLEDNLTNIWTLLNNGNYLFTPANQLSGTGRFFIHVTNSTLDVEENMLNGLQIYVPATTRTIRVQGQLSDNVSVFVYDMQGRQVLRSELDMATTSQEINANMLSSGVYIVKVDQGTQNISQKVIIN